MSKSIHPEEKLIQTITYKGVDFELVERPDVIWVGCLDYADNNADESDIGATLARFQNFVKEEVPKKSLMNPDWSAALSINYTRNDKPCGIMFANETYSAEQDKRFDLFTQPGGLWLRVRDEKSAAEALFGREVHGTFEYFGALRNAAKENGYLQNPEVNVEIEYHCHAEYSTPPHTNYAYIAVTEAVEK